MREVNVSVERRTAPNAPRLDAAMIGPRDLDKTMQFARNGKQAWQEDVASELTACSHRGQQADEADFGGRTNGSQPAAHRITLFQLHLVADTGPFPGVRAKPVRPRCIDREEIPS